MIFLIVLLLIFSLVITSFIYLRFNNDNAKDKFQSDRNFYYGGALIIFPLAIHTAFQSWVYIIHTFGIDIFRNNRMVEALASELVIFILIILSFITFKKFKYINEETFPSFESAITINTVYSIFSLFGTSEFEYVKVVPHGENFWFYTMVIFPIVTLFTVMLAVGLHKTTMMKLKRGDYKEEVFEFNDFKKIIDRYLYILCGVVFIQGVIILRYLLM